MPTLKIKVQPIIVKCTDIVCNMTKGLIGALGCGLGCGILVVCVESEEEVVKN